MAVVSEHAEDTMMGRFLTFNLDAETYGIGIRYVIEIIGLQSISKLPDMPDYIRGIINLRGNIIPVVDMRIKFKKEPREDSDRTCIIVIETERMTAGLIVDEVAEVITLDEADIAPPPAMNASVEYLSGIGKIAGEVVILLDCAALFSDEEQKWLNETKK